MDLTFWIPALILLGLAALLRPESFSRKAIPHVDSPDPHRRRDQQKRGTQAPSASAGTTTRVQGWRLGLVSRRWRFGLVCGCPPGLRVSGQVRE